MEEIPEITGMRGFASLGVVAFHLFTLSSFLRALPLPFVLSWDSGVDFFFVISGFLLAIPFMGPRRVSLRAFYVKRIFRILPVYYLSMATCGIALIALNHATLQQLLTSLVFAQSFSPLTFNSINGVTWTLVIEEIFYATLPLFAFFFAKNRWRYSLPACIVISAAYRLAVVQLYPADALAFHLWQYPSFVGHYAIGVTLAGLYADKKMQAARFSSSLPLLAVVVSLLVSQSLVGTVYSIGNNVVPLPGLLFSFEYGALIYFVLTSPVTSRIRAAFSNRVMTFAGKISYSTYTWHLPIEIGLLQLGLPTFAWAVLSVGVALSIATLSFRNLETPFLSYKTKFIVSRGWT